MVKELGQAAAAEAHDEDSAGIGSKPEAKWQSVSVIEFEMLRIAEFDHALANPVVAEAQGAQTGGILGDQNEIKRRMPGD
jgi:hypothetical protein